MFPQWMVGNQGAVRQGAGPLVTCHALPDASTPLGSKVAHRLPAACLACAPADMSHVESAESRDVQRLTTPITMPHTRVHPMAMKVSVTTLAMLTNYSTGGHGKAISLPLSYDTTAGRAPDFVAAAGAAALQMDTLQPRSSSSSSSSGCQDAPITNRCACRRWLRCRTTALCTQHGCSIQPRCGGAAAACCALAARCHALMAASACSRSVRCLNCSTRGLAA
jgi:hypothetical protein